MTSSWRLALAIACLGCAPVAAQETIGQPPAAPPLAAPVAGCGSQPLAIARMQWPSAAILAEIHARLLASELGCQTQVLPGDLGATGASMAANGQPAVAPEMWVARIAETWNTALADGSVRSAGPSFTDSVLEGWFIPGYLAARAPQLLVADQIGANMDAFSGGGARVTPAPAPTPTDALAPDAAAPEAEVPTSEQLPLLALPAGTRPRFISCPPDWACALINRNLLAAHGLTEQFELVEPANRFEMDNLIGEAVSRREPVLFYYWQPNAVLSQFDFRPLDMGAYSAEALNCLARRVCEDPQPTSFAPEDIVVALSDWVWAELPEVAGYFSRASMPLVVMNDLMSQLSEPGVSVEAVADGFVSERSDIWQPWVGGTIEGQ